MTGPRVRPALRKLVSEVASNAVCVGPSTVARIVAECGGEVTAQEVAAALVQQLVQVAELPTLPATPPPEMPGTLLETLQDLNARLSVQVVFADELIDGFTVLDGFALANGRTLDQVALTHAEARLAAGPAGPDRERRLAVLADLGAVVGIPRALDAIVLWEVVRLLRGQAQAGLSQMELAKQASMLHLARNEAAVVAAALVEESHDGAAADAPPLPAPRPSEAPISTVKNLEPEPAPPVAPEPVAAVRPPAAPPAPKAPGLTVRPGRNGKLAVTWTVPAGASIELRRAAERPIWRRGSSITTTDVRTYGTAEPTAAAVPTSDGRMRLELAVPVDRTFLTAFARIADTAVVGDSAVLSTSEPVRELRMRRFGNEVRLRWEWPDGAVATVVTWTPAAGNGGPPQTRRCTRREFFERGGHSVAVGHGAGTVVVQAAFGYEATQVLASGVEISVPAVGVPVEYEVVPRSRDFWGRPRDYGLRVTASEACVLPDLVLVAGYGRRRPELPSDGTQVARVPGRAIGRGETVVVPVDAWTGKPEWLVCLVDPDAPTSGEEIVLHPHSFAEMRRR